MNHHYSDIIAAVGKPPLWWDEYAVPRYCEFEPGENAYIYADHVVLLLIECQGCGTEFKVCMSGGQGYPDGEMSDGTAYKGRKGLDELIEADEIHYGDPPNAGCCAAGPTMNSIPRRVLEFWDKHDEDGKYLWDARRRPELEREIACDWAEDVA